MADGSLVFRCATRAAGVISPPPACGLHIARQAATAALQQLCREGRAMFDFTTNVFRCRQLLPFAAPQDELDTRSKQGARLAREGRVKIENISSEDAGEFLERYTQNGAQLFSAEVQSDGGTFTPTIALDADGRAIFAQCSCGFYRANKLRRGPCGHILAATAVASQATLATIE